MIRIDPRTRSVTRRIALGSAPSALALAGGSVWAAATASRASHRGGTLRFESGPSQVLQLHRPGGLRRGRLAGAVAGLRRPRRLPSRRRAPAAARWSPISPRASRSRPTAGAPTRSSCAAGCGSPTARRCGPRTSARRSSALVRLAGQVAPFYAGIVGADACSPRRCDLAQGHRDRRRGADDHHPPAPARPRVRCTSSPYLWPTCSRRGRRRRSSAGAPRRERARTGSRRSHRHAARGWCATRAFARGRPRRVPTGSPTRSPSRPPRMPRRRWPPCSTAAPTQSSPPACPPSSCRSTRRARLLSPTPATCTRRPRRLPTTSSSTCASARSMTRGSAGR